MKHTEIAQAALGLTFKEDQLVKPDDKELQMHEGKAIVWAHGNKHDDGTWRIARLSTSNPYAPTDRVAKMYAEPIDGGYKIVSGRAADLSNWDNPFGELVTL